MFHALANGKIETGEYRFEHQLLDIETLNRRALESELELTAVSVHAYAYLADKYVLCPCGASIGERYGPMVVAPRRGSVEQMRHMTIAVPGTLTTAYLALRLCLGRDFAHAVVPFDQIIPAVVAGSWNDKRIDAGLIIHEGQLTYGQHGLELVFDLGQWWYEETQLPLPLGANAIRKGLGNKATADVTNLLRSSIQYGLDHRQEALDYALQFGRDLNREQADQFVAMYVNRWTLDLGQLGRQAVAAVLARGYHAGVIPKLVEPEFVQ
jgi:1,4-dihydroxy-6-naphthoate synthase